MPRIGAPAGPDPAVNSNAGVDDAEPVDDGRRNRGGDPEIEIAAGGPERVETTATFSEPGEYVLRVFANDRSGGRGSQCCWTNAFVRVNVS